MNVIDLFYKTLQRMTQLTAFTLKKHFRELCGVFGFYRGF